MTGVETVAVPAASRLDRPYRVGVLTSHVIQNQDPLFQRLAEQPSIELEVLFCSRQGFTPYRDKDLGITVKWDLELLQGYRHRFLRNLSRRSHGMLRLVNPGIVPAVARGRYDALIVMGWGSVTTWLAFAACEIFDVPIFLVGDSSFVVESPTWRGRVRRKILAGLFSRVDAFLVMGAMNGDFYRAYGGNEQRFFHVPYAIDNARFAATATMTAEERRTLRASYDIAADAVVIVFSGKLQPLKNPDHLLDAFEAMRHRERATLVYIGDGVLRPDLERSARERGLDGVRFLGFVNQSDIPRLYGMADVMVLPSARDHRGTVVNEAMACGLPVIISDQVGVWGPGDIVRHGENGFVFPVGDRAELARYLDVIVENAGARQSMGQKSREIISQWSFEADTNGILQALTAQGLPRAR